MTIKFRTKAALLRRINKDPKNVRFVDSMIRRWRVVKEWEDYVLSLNGEVVALINFVLWMCENEEEKEWMLKRIYDVLYNK